MLETLQPDKCELVIIWPSAKNADSWLNGFSGPITSDHQTQMPAQTLNESFHCTQSPLQTVQKLTGLEICAAQAGISPYTYLNPMPLPLDFA
jgi:hypothetical protein